MGNPAPKHFVAAAAVLACVLVIAVVAATRDDTPRPRGGGDDRQIVVGEVEGVPMVDAPAEGAPLPEGPGVRATDGGRTLVAVREPAGSAGVLPPDGAHPGPAIPFLSSRRGFDELVFVLVAGSDARPGEDVTRTRADSIHVVAVNPGLGAGTIVGIPRDAWVEVSGHGEQKINSALALGGPQLLARTVADATGMPLRWFVITGFDGLIRLTDDLGGVNVHLDRRMDDRNSGARFDRGWHFFHGEEALAFSRNRKDVAYGDFSRSENQGVLMLATLAKMRAEVGDDGGIGRWLEALHRHVRLDIGMDDVFELGVTARRLDPRRMANVVASGRVGTARGQSVVFLDDEARAMFADVADDGVLRRPPPPYDPPGGSGGGSGGGGGGGGTAPGPAPGSSTTTSTPRPPATVIPPTSTTSAPGSTTTTTGLLPIN